MGGRYRSANNDNYVFAEISGKKANANDTDADGYLTFNIDKNGVGLVEMMRLDSRTNVVNFISTPSLKLVKGAG